MQAEQIQPQPALEIQQRAECRHQQGEQQGAASGENAEPQPGKEQAPGPPQNDKHARGVQPRQFPGQGWDQPEPRVVNQHVPVRKDDGPRAGDQFTQTGISDDMVRVLVDPLPQPESAIRAANAARARNEERVNRGKAGRESLVCGSLRFRGVSPAAIRSVRGRAAYQCIHPARNTSTGSRSQAQVCHFSAVALNACSGHGASAAGGGISPEP